MSLFHIRVSLPLFLHNYPLSKNKLKNFLNSTKHKTKLSGDGEKHSRRENSMCEGPEERRGKVCWKKRENARSEGKAGGE